MAVDLRKRLVPYERVSPGFEAVYTGEKAEGPVEPGSGPVYSDVDADGNVIQRWSTWTWTWQGREAEWDEEIRHINRMQAALGHLDAETRRIRAHIGSLVPCESTFPVTADELLEAIGRGRLAEQPFHNGCWCTSMWWDSRGAQVGRGEAMQTVEDCLRGYLRGDSQAELIARFPYAGGFLRRMFQWLGPADELMYIQRLMIERMLVPFEFFAWRRRDYDEINRESFGEGGRGEALDAEIARLAGLPKIYPDYTDEFRRALAHLTDPYKKELYGICGRIAHGLHGLSDCHHSSFRWIEGWIHGIGTGTWRIPTRRAGAERQRLGRLLFGYALALDKWLLVRPMQFLLLDLGHVDLAFDPKNEILRVYVRLGEARTPVKQWLVACLWRTLTQNVAGLNVHPELVDAARRAGVSVREWMDAALRGEASRTDARK